MSVMIRLSRQGAKKRPQYQVVVVEKSRRRDGAVLERLGYYYPKEEKPENKIKLNREAVDAWIAKGALPSERVGQLLKITSK